MAFRLEQPNDFPSDAFQALLRVSPEQRELIHRYLECSDEVQSVVRSMFAVLENPDVTTEDRDRALCTIADALHLRPEEGHGNYGYDLAKIERETVAKHPDVHRRPAITQRLEQLDSQQSQFSQRLRELLEQKHITQDELAARIGCTQSAVSKMLARQSRPHKKTILKMAAALHVAPNLLWPDLEVASILDSIADFPADRDLTAAQAAELDAAIARPPAKVPTRDLPSRRRK